MRKTKVRGREKEEREREKVGIARKASYLLTPWEG